MVYNAYTIGSPASFWFSIWKRKHDKERRERETRTHMQGLMSKWTKMPPTYVWYMMLEGKSCPWVPTAQKCGVNAAQIEN